MKGFVIAAALVYSLLYGTMAVSADTQISPTVIQASDAITTAANLVGPPAYKTAQCQEMTGLGVQPAAICVSSKDAALNNVGLTAGKSLGQAIAGF